MLSSKNIRLIIKRRRRRKALQNDDKIALMMENVTKKFPGTIAVNNVTFEVREGEVHALIGENGAGKSTLMKMIAGYYNDYTGSIRINGKEVLLSSPAVAKQSGIAMIYQELSLANPLSVTENLLAGRLPSKGILVDKKAADIQAKALLSRVGLGDLNPKTLVSQLSPHEMQLVEIAKALGREPKIIVMDEPTSTLTREEVDRLFEIIKKLKESGLTIIYISHHLPEIFQVADRVSIMRDGNKVGTFSIDEVNTEKLAEMMVGRKITKFYQNINYNIGDEVLRVEHLWRYGFFHDVSFSVRRGEIVGLCGLSGAGRSEIARSICGLDALDKGEIYLKGQRIRIRNMSDAIKKGIAYLTEKQKSRRVGSSAEYGKQPFICNTAGIKQELLLPCLRSGIKGQRTDRIFKDQSA